jgi:gluconokinase
MPTRDQNPVNAPLVLALDVGTSSVRALLFDRRGRALPKTEAQTAFDLTTTPDGGAFVDAEMLFDLVGKSIDQCLEAAGELGDKIGGVGICSFWHSLMGVGPDGNATTPVLLWADTRSAREVEELRAAYDQREVHRRTGCVIHSSYWPAKLRWLRRSSPEEFSRTVRWCGFADYLLRRLTGLDVTSISMASGTGLLDVRAGCWDSAAVAMAGVSPESLPRIADAGESAMLDQEFASRWAALATKPWFPGLGDGACANVGTGGVGNDRIALSLGTSGAMRIVVEHPVGSEFEFPDDLWAYRLDHQRVVIGAAISNGGKVLAWLSDLLRVEFDGSDIRAAGELQPDSHGLTVLPFLAGERSPIWNDRATAVVAGLTLNTGRPELLRAGMESVSLRLARLYEGLQRVAAGDHQVVANGAALLSSPVWLKITADALNHAIVALPPGEESSARGAAIMALLWTGATESLRDVDDPASAAKSVEPGEPGVAAYRVALERQRALERLLFPNGSSWEMSVARGSWDVL